MTDDYEAEVLDSMAAARDMDAHTDVPEDVEKVLDEARQMIEVQAVVARQAKKDAEDKQRATQRRHYNALKYALKENAPAALLPYFDIGPVEDFGADWRDNRKVTLALPGCSLIICQFERDNTNHGAWRMTQGLTADPHDYPVEWYKFRVITYQVSEDYEVDGLHEDRFIVHEADYTRCTYSNDLMLAIGSAQRAEDERLMLEAEAAEKNANYREHREEDMAAGRDWTAPAPPPPLTLSPAEEQMILAWRAMDAEREAYRADRYDGSE